MERSGCRWHLSLHGEHFCALILGRHGWMWYRKSGTRDGFIKRAEGAVSLLRMLWVLRPAENHCPCPTLFLSLPAVAEAPRPLRSVRKQPKAVGTSLSPRDWAWIWKLLVGARVAPGSNPCLWSRKPRRSQLLLSGTGCSDKWLLMQLWLVGRTAAWLWPPAQCRHARNKGPENNV